MACIPVCCLALDAPRQRLPRPHRLRQCVRLMPRMLANFDTVCLCTCLYRRGSLRGTARVVVQLPPHTDQHSEPWPVSGCTTRTAWTARHLGRPLLSEF